MCLTQPTDYALRMLMHASGHAERPLLNIADTARDYRNTTSSAGARSQGGRREKLARKGLFKTGNALKPADLLKKPAARRSAAAGLSGISAACWVFIQI